ncbi:MAG: NAD(P)/FAD-dependent oxidoreductase [Hormoscilla sp. GM7CHS1pb]|nr:NAD(P)/FAD-dependent oxidoreductase [Hormoscilla sp. GM7CHS1pb]
MTVSQGSRFVIVGAGVGGLVAARSLASAGVEVLLVDRHNYHSFVPLIYQVAAAQLPPELIAYPIRRILRRQNNVHFLMTEVKQIDFTDRVLETDGPTIPYDFLVLATESQSQFLGVPGAAENTLPLTTIAEALTLRNHFLHCFERAVAFRDPAQLPQLLTFAIVGGGPAGVELAGAWMELIKGPLAKDYPHLDWQQVRVIILQSANRLLPHLPRRLGEYAQKQLRKLGVKVHLQARVREVTADAVYLEDGTIINASTIVWTAGVEAHFRDPTAVEPTLQLPEHPEVYAIEDLSLLEGQALIGVAPTAQQLGVAVARNILLQLKGEDPLPFQDCAARTLRDRDIGRAAIIKRNAGVAKLGKLNLTGFLPWLLCLGVRWFYLPGFRNRLAVLYHWICDYLWGDRPYRHILPSPDAIASEIPDIVTESEKSSIPEGGK